MPATSSASTPRKRAQLSSSQRQITSFFPPSESPSASPAQKLAPELPAHVQSSLLSVGMRVRRTMAQKPAVFGLQSHEPAAQITTLTTDASVQETSALKRTRDGEDDMVKDTETLEQREAERVLPPQRTGGSSVVRRLGPGTKNTGSGAARIGGYWKAVKRVEKPVNKKAELAQQDFEEASFLKMEIDG